MGACGRVAVSFGSWGRLSFGSWGPQLQKLTHVRQLAAGRKKIHGETPRRCPSAPPVLRSSWFVARRRISTLQLAYYAGHAPPRRLKPVQTAHAEPFMLHQSAVPAIAAPLMMINESRLSARFEMPCDCFRMMLTGGTSATKSSGDHCRCGAVDKVAGWSRIRFQ